MKTYSELSNLKTFEERFDYLHFEGAQIGADTFGYDRWLNQQFYKSKEWKRIRDLIIVRDGGCDLGIPGADIGGKIIIHHMNPIAPKDIIDQTNILLNPEFLICTSQRTHNAIHFGVEKIQNEFVERSPNDTCPWKN